MLLNPLMIRRGGTTNIASFFCGINTTQYSIHNKTGPGKIHAKYSSFQRKETSFCLKMKLFKSALDIIFPNQCINQRNSWNIFSSAISVRAKNDRKLKRYYRQQQTTFQKIISPQRLHPRIPVCICASVAEQSPNKKPIYANCVRFNHVGVSVLWY